ncbi:MAG: SDR family oxidoreductase [Marinicella sp.]|nr:SDR family oxidoreductase [Xanthomonadales bacterium]
MNKKIMVITGAASGLGKAIALAAAKQGYDIAVADVQQQAGEQTVADIKESSREAAFFYCDVSKTDDLLALKNAVIERFGQVDVLINNAGVGAQGTVCEASEEQWDRQWQINLMGVVRGCQAFIPQLKKSPQAAIVNVASFAAIALAPGVASYNVVKAGVVALSETLRCELAEANIHVSVLCPAFFKTNLTESMHDADEKIKNQINRWMDKSKYGADDVAEMVLSGIERKKFMILCDSTTRWQSRIARWFPNYFYKQKVKMMKRMFK